MRALAKPTCTQASARGRPPLPKTRPDKRRPPADTKELDEEDRFSFPNRGKPTPKRLRLLSSLENDFYDEDEDNDYSDDEEDAFGAAGGDDDGDEGVY